MFIVCNKHNVNFREFVKNELVLDNIFKYLDKTQILILVLTLDLSPNIYKLANFVHIPYKIGFHDNKIMVTLF